MVAVLYLVTIEAIICGLMLNRALYSRTLYMWHLPVYVIVKAVVCTYAVYLGFLMYVTPLCILFSALYTFICFSDSIKRKTAVLVCGIISLGISNLIKLTTLSKMGLTQRFAYTPDYLSTISVICFSILIFSLMTILFTNLLCRVRLYVIGRIFLVSLLALIFSAFVYYYMHTLIPVQQNKLYSVFALFLLLPSVVMLYFGEAIAFSRKDNYFKI